MRGFSAVSVRIGRERVDPCLHMSPRPSQHRRHYSDYCDHPERRDARNRSKAEKVFIMERTNPSPFSNSIRRLEITLLLAANFVNE